MPICICEIDKKNLRFLGKIRDLDQCWVAEQDQVLWLKLTLEERQIPLQVQQIPVEGRYLLDEKNRLFPFKGLTPVKELPSLHWRPIATFLSVEMPTAALPGIIENPFSIELIRSEQMAVAKFLLLPWEIWQDFVVNTAHIRLAPLSFAVSDQQEVLVSGSPLPALPGQSYWKDRQVLLPAGQQFRYPVVADFLSEMYAKEKDKLLLFRSGKQCEVIAAKDFKKTSRSAIRRTQIHLNSRSSHV